MTTKPSTYITSALIILIYSAISISVTSAFGIGIAPAMYEITDAFRGGEYERTITIFNPDDNAKNFALRTEDEAGRWIGFYKIDDKNTSINNISVGAKENKAFLAILKIPLEEAVGKYNATIIAETIPDNITTAGSMATVLQGRTRIFISIIGDQVVDGVVNSISADNTEIGYPVRINTVFRNTGNVVVKPRIEVTILKENTTINSFIQESTKVRPTSNEPIIVEWNTTSKEIPDDYKAKVVVSLDDRIIKSEDVSFKILPMGTITRQGNLTSIYIEGEPKVDSVAIVKGIFLNTGFIETPAKFSAEVYKDNILIETISSDELTVPKNNRVVLTSYLKLSSAGNYQIKGKVIFSGKETPVKEYSFDIPKSIPGFDALYVVLIFLIIFSLIDRRNRGG